MNNIKYILVFLTLIFSCDNKKVENNDWIYLFDGTTTSGLFVS